MTTEIVFEAYTGGDVGEGSGAISLISRGSISASNDFGVFSFRSEGVGVVPIVGHGHSTFSFIARSGNNGGAFNLRANGYVTPIIPDIIIGYGTISFGAAGEGTYIADGGGGFSLSSKSGNGAGFSFGSFGLEAQIFVGGVGVFQSPGYLRIQKNDNRIVVIESLLMTSTIKSLPIFKVLEDLTLNPQMTHTGHLKSKIVESLTFGDLISVIWKLLIQENLTLAPTMTPSLNVAAKIVESLRLVAGPPTTYLQARNIVSAALVLGDHSGFNFKEIIQEELQLTDSMRHQMAAHSKIIDQMILGDTPHHGATFSAIVQEELVLGDTVNHVASMKQAIKETLYLSAILNIDDQVHSAWVVNTLNKAMTEYDNFPFNSFFELAGKFYGVAETGLYELTGSDDAGTPIESYVRTGLTNLGTGKEKRTPSMYLGFTSNGTIALKAITTSPQGEKIENWYELTPVTANVSREGRIRMGRGMESVYWQYEAHSVDGSKFSLNTMELYPVILDRRIRSN